MWASPCMSTYLDALVHCCRLINVGPMSALVGVVGHGNAPRIPNTRTGELTTQACRHGPLESFNDPSECKMGMEDCRKCAPYEKALETCW